MAYGQLYEVTFRNRVQNDVFRVELWKKDAETEITTLEGADTPFTAEYQNSDDNLFNPIKTLITTLRFISDGTIDVEDFYSEDDEAWRMDFYIESLNGGTPVNRLLHSCYVVQDECSEEITDIAHVIALKATDNLGLLRNVPITEPFGGTEDVYGIKPVIDIINNCLSATGLDLDLQIFANIFENTTDDRGDDDEAELFSQSAIHTGTFRNSDGEYQDCYTVLTKILSGVNACLLQSGGKWVIIRIGEYSQFTDGAIPGTEFTPTAEAVTLSPAVDIGRRGTIIPVNEDQIKSIQRPYKYVKNNFDYVQPAQLIIQQDLLLPDGATPYDTDTDGDLQYDKYDLATYFPFWKTISDDVSYLVVVTNTVTDTEVERYIVCPHGIATRGGMQMNPIAVSAGDTFDLTLQWRTDVDTDDLLRFYVRITLITPDDKWYGLFAGYGTSPRWSGPFSISGTYPVDGVGEIYMEFANPDDIDTTEWTEFNVSQFLTDGRRMPKIPVDGILLIEVQGTNGDVDYNDQTVYWKEIDLEFTQYINESTKITGQSHTQEQDVNIKNKYDESVNVDDSPRHSIAGTLFTTDLTSFEADIGDVYFTKTSLWHRKTNSEELRLGQIIVLERMTAQYVTRRMIEGSFMNIRYGDDSIVNMLNLITVAFYPGKYFLFSLLNIDYMECSFNGKMIELFADTDDVDSSYKFAYVLDSSK